MRRSMPWVGSLLLGGFLALSGCTGTVYIRESGPPPVVIDRPAPVIVDQPAPPPAEADVAVDANFQADLAPYGEWVVVAEYGRVWRPRVAVDWRPYTVGHWVETDLGLTWASDEPYGAVVFHYGRWVEAGGGWCWVAGNVWGPAWVSWRSGGEYMGWAPLGPSFHVGIDIHVGGWEPAPSAYCFVGAGDITAVNIHNHIVNVHNNTTIINNTTNITNITVVNNRVVNRSINTAQLEGRIGHRFERAPVQTVTSVTAARGTRGIAIYQPRSLRTVDPHQERVGHTPTLHEGHTPTLHEGHTPTEHDGHTPTLHEGHTPVVTPTHEGHAPVVTPNHDGHTPVVTPSHTPVVTPSHTPVVTPSHTPVVTPTRTPIVTPREGHTPVITPREGHTPPTSQPGRTGH